MKLVAEYIADAVKFERMAAQEKNPNLKAALLRQGVAYRKLAADRAQAMGIPLPVEALEQ